MQWHCSVCSEWFVDAQEKAKHIVSKRHIVVQEYENRCKIGLIDKQLHTNWQRRSKGRVGANEKKRAEELASIQEKQLAKLQVLDEISARLYSRLVLQIDHERAKQEEREWSEEKKTFYLQKIFNSLDIRKGISSNQVGNSCIVARAVVAVVTHNVLVSGACCVQMGL